MLKISLTNESESIVIEKDSSKETYNIKNNDGQSVWFTEQELRELKYLISDILQYVHKNDYE